MEEPMATIEKRQEIQETDAVTVEGISMHYPGGVHALDDINLSIPRGKMTAILGPSGCGKTTLLKIIAGLLQPTSGNIFVHGKKTTAPGPERAFVFQDFALLPWASVLRNVAFGLELRGCKKNEREEIARKFIAKIGLTGFEDHYPHQLSGGMRQRAGLARALVINADILMMDEPFSAVDEQMRRKLQEDLLSMLAVDKKTVIFVTHSIEEAVYLADQIAILSPRPGRISKIVSTDIHRDLTPDQIRRDRRYLDMVDEIWAGLKQYLV